MKTKNQQLLEEINKAFARNDSAFLVEHVTDTIQWEIVGDKTVEGKDAFAKTLRDMEADEPMELMIHNILTHGKGASVNGEMKTSDGKVFAFCDVYKFSGFKNPKITNLTSYVIEVKS